MRPVCRSTCGASTGAVLVSPRAGLRAALPPAERVTPARAPKRHVVAHTAPASKTDFETQRRLLDQRFIEVQLRATRAIEEAKARALGPEPGEGGERGDGYESGGDNAAPRAGAGGEPVAGAPPARASRARRSRGASKRFRAQVSNAVEALGRGLVEREAEVRLMLLAALAGEHVLFLGPPGTAKSELGRRLSRVAGGPFFERLLTRFSVPEELFGPLSLRALDDDRYLRQTAGYLPTARVAFVDEIFKANSSILNSLLTILNERAFDNGSQRLRVPLTCLVAASNEMPDADELDALYDRFLLRRRVRPLTDDGAARLLRLGNPGTPGSPPTHVEAEYASHTGGHEGPPAGEAEANEVEGAAADAPEQLLNPDDLAACRRKAHERVTIPDEVVRLLIEAREFLRDRCDPPSLVSDRRLNKAADLLRVATFTNGRDVVTTYDCLVLSHVLWHQPEQAPQLADWLLGRLAEDDGLARSRLLLRGLFRRATRTPAPGPIGGGDAGEGGTGGVRTDPPAAAPALSAAYEELLSDVSALESLCVERLSSLHGALESALADVRADLWVAPHEAERVAASLEPRLAASVEEAERLLEQVVVLGTVLRDGGDSSHLAELLPSLWSDFIQNADVNELRPLATRKVKVAKAVYQGDTKAQYSAMWNERAGA